MRRRQRTCKPPETILQQAPLAVLPDLRRRALALADAFGCSESHVYRLALDLDRAEDTLRRQRQESQLTAV